MSQLPGQLPLFGTAEPTPEPDTDLAGLRAENQASFERLRTMGAFPNPGSVLAMRLELLIETLLTGAQRAAYDLAFETNMREMLAELHQQVVAAKFTRGTDVPPSKGLLLPR